MASTIVPSVSRSRPHLGVREQVFLQDVTEEQLLGDALVGQQARRCRGVGKEPETIIFTKKKIFFFFFFFFFFKKRGGGGGASDSW